MNIERAKARQQLSNARPSSSACCGPGSRSRAASAARGVPVTGIAYEPTDFGVRSRHLTRRIVASRDRDELLLAALREAAHDGRPVLFPERDESVHVVLRHWDEVRELADLPLPDDAQVVTNLRRKDLLRAEARARGRAAAGDDHARQRGRRSARRACGRRT